jgi:hypothetical protein
MTYLETHIALPPGALPANAVREIVETAVHDFGWLKLERFGRSEPDTAVRSGGTGIDAALAIYEQRQRLAVGTAKKDAILQFLPDRTGAASHLGEITWFVKPPRARDSAWREAHAIQVADVMNRVNSPYAFAALDEDIQRKTMREAETEQGTIRTYTVRTYADGLAGLFWRNFFAGPFLQLFGERLATLPADASRQLTHGVRLIQPYPAPEDALAAEGAARETTLIEHLGAGAFYDRARHTQPTLRPPLPALPTTE